ncbi:aminobenzoyl-glutamate transporter [Fulvitalea axinellae]|uniref:Aminobenzoyl-glutamate transporter n=1 Tax=Fulvitalea axinellae TaxID=1182444 RepID=A0AAU9CDI0_9BACT|nr:aminobenzoyl-glutamate transporter [Fulvitalea axinellae]
MSTTTEKEISQNPEETKGLFNKFLSVVEKAGNALPHPATLFAGLALLVVVLSGITAGLGLEVTNPGTGEVIRPVNLMTVEGLHRILTGMVTNFTGFAPLGVVLVAMLGIGIAEGSGLIGALIRLMVLSAPKRMMTFMIVFAGVISNTASEVGYVLLVPLAAIIFLGMKRHPIAGLAAAFAGVSGGYSANLLLGTIDPLLAGISQESANIIHPVAAGLYTVNPASNYFFMFASTFLIALAGTWVTEKIVIPRLGVYEGDEQVESVEPLNDKERRGLKIAGLVVLALLAIIVAGIAPEGGFLRNPDPEMDTMQSILKSPLMKGIVSFIFLLAAGAGIAYGFAAKTYKNDSDVMDGMANSMKTLGSYIVLVFFAAQFVAYFKWTNLGFIFAINGAQMLQALDPGVIPLMIAFILLTCMINMVMGSASAKWTLMAPVFIPMFMQYGVSPELTQLVYRIGDSVTNIISPMMSYFALIVAFIQRYDKKASIGTMIATMLPYSLVFLAVWTILLVIWMLAGWPIGPDAPLDYVMPS